MKSLNPFLGSISIVLVFGYILFNELNKPGKANLVEQIPERTKEGKTISFDLPQNMSFAGEEVPLYVLDVLERLDREIHINIYWHTNTIFLIKRANRWLPIIEKILVEKGVPEDFKYVAVIESNLMNSISTKNAVGFWQFMKPTAKEFGLEVNTEIDERYNLIKATEAAARYLQKAYEKFGNWALVAASYDRGMGGMQRALENQKVNSYYDLYLNEETYRYVFRILAAKEILMNPEKYGFEVKQDHLYDPVQNKEILVDKSIDDLVEFSKEIGINYKLLKRYNPWLRSDKLTVKKGKSYTILVPVI